MLAMPRSQYVISPAKAKSSKLKVNTVIMRTVLLSAFEAMNQATVFTVNTTDSRVQRDITASRAIRLPESKITIESAITAMKKYSVRVILVSSIGIFCDFLVAISVLKLN